MASEITMTWILGSVVGVRAFGFSPVFRICFKSWSPRSRGRRCYCGNSVKSNHKKKVRAHGRARCIIINIEKTVENGAS